jgi:hypothetical protein
MNWRDNQMSWSGNSNLESAVNWLLEHESDPYIDQLPLVGYFLTIFISRTPFSCACALLCILILYSQ